MTRPGGGIATAPCPVEGQKIGVGIRVANSGRPDLVPDSGRRYAALNQFSFRVTKPDGGLLMLRTRRSTWCKGIVAAAACSAMLTLAAAGSVATPSVAGAASTSAQASAIRAIVRNAIETDHLRAVIVRVTIGNKPVITQAFGSSLTGEPATTSMNFRNGAVAFSYVATLLMEYVDEHKISLSDPVSKWMPSLPEASKVTVKMLANMTSGYPDYVTDPAFLAAFNADPFRPITVAERLAYAFKGRSLSLRERTGATRTRTT